MIPGSGLLGAALNVIGSDAVQWSRFLSRERNALGQWVSTYADPVEIEGSVQPVEVRDYKDLGLDLSRRYITLFTEHNTQHVKRGASPDKFVWGGAVWEPQGGDDWYLQDGWREVILVCIGDADE